MSNNDNSKGKMAYTVYWTIIKTSRNNPVTRFLIDWLALFYYKLFRCSKTFVFNSSKYKYFYHIYNRTVAGERVIEIPIAKRLLDKYEGRNILEVGNVFSHYYKIKHEVLDKYERENGVINKDVINYKSKKKYDLILSVSTMEHVGFSYGEKLDPAKFSIGIRNLKTLIKPGGVLFITVDPFVNQGIKKLINENKMPFTKNYFMKRTSFLNEWKQISRKEVFKIPLYDDYYANANVLYLGFYKKK